MKCWCENYFAFFEPTVQFNAGDIFFPFSCGVWTVSLTISNHETIKMNNFTNPILFLVQPCPHFFFGKNNFYSKNYKNNL